MRATHANVMQKPEPAAAPNVIMVSDQLSLERGMPMKTIGIVFGLVLAFSSTAALAQTAAPPGAPGVIEAPVGHRQPRPAEPPTSLSKDSVGMVAKDDPAALDRRLQASNDAAIRSICADCLKPLPKSERP
ncbi:hypothetical protein [Labrys wisconsinensis]|uniref:Uncharacterized protein n=1 Tax=Labrys wisconsinensis TaxID=425677 RepID=A0ABU0JD21_9HYPH|nr:hypothetical protein [Labrys wisconsinensis]MDQ0471149.1 hypothetical protein [Labrys wisconsinensis]